MAGNAVQAAAETYIGLVEVGAGLIPGGSGTVQMMRNAFGRHATNKDVDPMSILQGVFMTVGMAKYAESAEEAKEMGFLDFRDGVSLNRSHVIRDAKERVLGMARSGFRPPRPMKFRLPGLNGVATVDTMLYSMLHNNQITPHQRKIGKKLAHVLCGGHTTTAALTDEQTLLELEREAFLSLCGEEKTHAAMKRFL
jgi:3-hydroxyacyl-CoA dehydrogenase